MTEPGDQTSSRPNGALNFRMVTHITSSISQDVGDADGHTVSLSRFSGLAFFADGTVATVYFQSLADYVNGAGTFTLYPIITFDDGSSLHIKSTGIGTVEGAKTRFVGTCTVLGGKGQFESASGSGTLTGIRYTPLAAGADLVSEYTIELRA